MFNPLTYYDRMQSVTEINGGLNFNEPLFNETFVKINMQYMEENATYNDLIQQNQQNNIIKNVGKIINFNMIEQNKIPIIIDNYVDASIHKKLHDALKNKGVMDMLLKLENCDDIIIPSELSSIIPIITKITTFEKQINSDIKFWNMWILIDIRSIKKDTTQRNAGFHYDGFNLNGRYKYKQNVSIYGWSNNLPTLFYTKGFDSECLNQYENKDLVNLSIYSHMKMNHENIFIPKSGDIVKFDGVTLHAGDIANENIYDRVFLRICFTPPGYWFDRKGNTINPFIEYPTEFTWNRISDPSVRLMAPLCFKNAFEFKQLWDVACFGHHAFSIYLEGDKSYQYKLINELKKRSNTKLMKKLLKLYNTGKSIDEFRLKTLQYYIDL